MSGVPVPVNIITEPFGSGATVLPPTDPGAVTLPIPLDSQVGVVVGAASFEDGFPPATMSDPETEGGVPPFGQDMNGILYMITAYLALLQAGQRVTYNAAAVAEFVGYAIGAELASVATPGRVWTNFQDGNVNDPDVVPTGWSANDTFYQAQAPLAGAYNDFALPTASDLALDLDTTAGAIDITGFVAQRDGQTLHLSNAGPNLLQVLALNAGSAAANRVRAPSDLAIVTNQTLTLKYIGTIDLWILV